jgi:hypothetical protein
MFSRTFLYISTICETTNFMSTSIIIGILFIGLVNFHNIMKNNFEIAKCQRGLNRIKHYFIKHHKDIGLYLIFPANDDTPPFKTQFPKLTAAINSVLASIGVPLFAHSIFAISLVWLYIFGMIVIATALLIQYKYFMAQARREEKLFKVQFPSESKK